MSFVWESCRVQTTTGDHPEEIPMKRILFLVLIAMMMLTVVVVADDVIINEGAPLEDNPIEPKVTEPAPIYNENPLDVKASYVTVNKSIITTILEFIGLESFVSQTEIVENTIDVFIGDFKAATIPEGSKFSNMVVHDTCLQFQYGTDDWYKCEVALL